MASIIAPYVAQLNGSGSGFVEAIEHTSVTITDIEYVFGKQASAALLASITVKNTDPSAGDAGLTVEYSDSTGDAFHAALMADMMAATGGVNACAFTTGQIQAPPAGSTLDVVLREEIRDEINIALSQNGVLAYLESDVVGGLTLAMEWSAGAADMRDNLDANVLKSMFLQLVNRTTPVGADASGNATNRALGAFLNPGDALGFVFNVDATIAITQNVENAPQDGNGAADTGNVYGTLNIAANYLRGYKVGFVFTK